MNYTKLLTKEEKAILCRIITGREFKELFRRNEQEFTKIKRGFRAKTLTDQDALSTAIANFEKPFISMFINNNVEVWLKEINENIERLKREGATHNTAVATTMLDSVFYDNVDLYIKLAGDCLDADSRSELYKRMENIKVERVRNAEVSDRIKALEEENQALVDKIESTLQSINAIKADYEERIHEVEQEKEQLRFLLAEAQERCSEDQSDLTSDENQDKDDLTTFDDTNSYAIPSINSDETISLCGVISDYSGQKWLIRYADLDHEGRYHTFYKNDDIPPYFANRDKIFYKDGPSDDGFYGIWTWSTIPNAKDSTKDYVDLSKYNRDIDVIEVVIIPGASSLDDIFAHLKDGIKYQPRSRRVLFSLYASRGKYSGILCSVKQLNVVNEKTTFNKECTVVPVYEFTSSDIIRLDNGFSFYRNAFAGMPIKLYYLKSRLEIVKEIVLSSVSWNTYKTRTLTRAEYRALKDILRGIPVYDIETQIESKCFCSKGEAHKLLEVFLESAWKYIDGNSLEDKIILSAISANENLQEETKALIREEWELENNAMLDKAKADLALIDSLKQDANRDLEEAQKSLLLTKSEEKHITDIIAEKEKLAEDVEITVANKIQKARENAAEFVANMAFVSGQQIQNIDSNPRNDMWELSEQDNSIYRTVPATEILDDLEAHHTWKDVINTVAIELSGAGIVEKYRNGLAAFLCAAYIQKQPILLVGPNATDIVQAFSAAINGNKHGILCCEGEFANHKIIKIGNDGEDIVVIYNLISSGWMNRLPEIISLKDVFYIAIHPYSEDIQVEPKSLYGFMQPLFTEFFVDNKPVGEYCGGYFADDFKTFTGSKGKNRDLKSIAELSPSALIRNRVNKLIAMMHDIHPETTEDDEFLFVVFPLAYASIKMNELIGVIADPQKDINISASLKRELKYILGEF